MSQFVNSYNSQNGQGVMPPGNMGGQWDQNMQGPQNNGQWGQQMQSQNMNRPNTQGWKSYSAPTITPTQGRWVDSFDEIKPQEVPMDGAMYLFPQNDWSCIYAKYWDNNGQLMSFRFLPEKVEQPAPGPLPDMNSIIGSYERLGSTMMDRLDSFEKRLNDIYDRLQTSQTTANKSRKVAKEDDAT